ncbi:MAG TPA: hypothetical protein ENN51_06260 [candidate division WOR-3 bacterium]|uniref:Uncharacterized protein n=1 Tax=candidate division WOR-3 bacterium TaxID=2052148 RepID=A0A7V0T6L1_UNCW3|nr:hypothetical protein [candidate division WOR-3 bacterium]
MMRVTAFIAALLLLAGCDEHFTCRFDPASTADVPVFNFGGKEISPYSARLVRFRIAGQPLEVRQWETFWDVQVPQGVRYELVSRIFYGEAPPGFEVITEPAHLLSGYVYTAIPGCHGQSEDCYFIITEDTPGVRVIRALTFAEFHSIINPGGG